jgi:hypothetical protein|tara:strand:+ start:240 stop:374 length:135 start_codon:yes stop_codon:yes gene_type:complete
MEENKFIPTRPDVKLVTERSGWVQPDGTIKFSKESRTFLKQLSE